MPPGRIRPILRAVYLLVGGGLAVIHWPGLLKPGAGLELDKGATSAMLLALSVLALLGLWGQLAVLPVLLFELPWKLICLVHVAMSQLLAGALQDGTVETLFAGVFAVPVLLVVPGELVWRMVGPACSPTREKD